VCVCTLHVFVAGPQNTKKPFLEVKNLELKTEVLFRE